MLLQPKQKILAITLLLTLLASAYTYYSDHGQTEPAQVGELLIESNQISINDAQNKYAQLTKNPIATHRPTESRRLFYTPMIDIFEVYVSPQVKIPVQNIPAETRPRPTKKTIVVMPQIIPQPAPPPTAPALPFRYIGKLLGDDEYIVFLSLHGKSLSVKMGDVLQQTYRVDEIKPPLMQVTYLPMNIQQTFMIGEP
jgi:hypothetical protein